MGERGGRGGGELEEQLGWWREALGGLPERLELPTDRPYPRVASAEGGVVEFEVPAEVHGGLQEVARSCGATLFMVVQAGLSGLLTRLGGGTDVAVGSPIAGRVDGALEELVGFFVNTLVLRVSTAGDPGFEELVGRVREADLGAYAHQEVPFERLVEALDPPRSLAHHPLYQVALILNNVPEVRLRLPGLTVGQAPIGPGPARHDLLFGLRERRGPDRSPA